MQNSVLAGDIRDKYGIFWSASSSSTVCIDDFAMKYNYWYHSGSNGRNIENIELSLSQILPVYLVERSWYLSVAVTGDKYCIFGQVQGALEN